MHGDKRTWLAAVQKDGRRARQVAIRLARLEGEGCAQPGRFRSVRSTFRCARNPSKVAKLRRHIRYSASLMATTWASVIGGGPSSIGSASPQARGTVM